MSENNPHYDARRVFKPDDLLRLKAAIMGLDVDIARSCPTATYYSSQSVRLPSAMLSDLPNWKVIYAK